MITTYATSQVKPNDEGANNYLADSYGLVIFKSLIYIEQQ